MAAGKPYVRRIPLKHWSWTTDDMFGVLMVHGWTVFTRPVTTWQFLLRDTMSRPERIASVTMSNGYFPLWLHKGNLWVSDHSATAEDVAAKGGKTKPRYNVKDQWWWGFTDPMLQGMMENIDRRMLGLKQRHEQVWKALPPRRKARTRSTAGSISVRDNRYIPQWVKIHVVLRDKGRCVYCSEDDPKLLEFDHRRAWSRGGSSKDPLNICLGCKSCNRSKSDKDWGWG